MKNWKVVIAILTGNVVLMSASYTMLIPFLPLYLSEDLHADPETLNFWTGAVFSVCFAICAVMAPIWGKLADSKGKKLMLIRSSVLIALTYFISAIVTTPFEMFLARCLQGFAAGMWPACLAIASAYSPKTKIGITMGIMQSANILGNIMGPLIGGVVANTVGIRNCFLISGSIVTFITIVTIFFIKEPPKDPSIKKVAPVSNMAIIKREGIFLLLCAAGLTNMVLLLLQPILPLYVGELTESSNNLPLLAGMVFSLSGIAGAIAAPFWGKQGQKHGFNKALCLALGSAGLLIASQCIPSSLVPFAILQFCVGLGFSGIFLSANALITAMTASHERGSAFGLIFSAQQIGGTIGPLLGAMIATFINLSSVFFISGLLLIGLACYIYLKAPEAMRSAHKQCNSPEAREELLEKIKQQVSEEINSAQKLKE